MKNSESPKPSPANPQSETFLRRLLMRLAGLPAGRISRWVIIGFWLFVIAGAFPLASRVSEVEDNGSQAFLPASSQSLQVANLREKFDTGDSSIAIVVYHRDDGLNADDNAWVTSNQQAIGKLDDRFQVSPPIPSDDKTTAIINIVIPQASDSQIKDDVDNLRTLVRKDAPEGLVIKVTGPAGIAVDLGKVFEGINGKLLLSAAIVVAVLLLITYRSPFLWIVPLLTVGLADRLATAVIFVLGKTFNLPVNGQSVGIMAILVFGAGTDYALLVIARYREELRREESTATAMRIAIRQAAPAIIASGGTVMLGLACLFLADLKSNQSLGPIGIVAILSALLLTLTLLPAILVLAGRRIFWPFIPQVRTGVDDSKSIWGRIGEWIERMPRRIWIPITVFLVVLSLGVTQYSISFSQADQFTNQPEAIQGAALIADSFPAGASSPATVIASASSASEVESTLKETPGVASIQPGAKTADLISFSVIMTAEPGTQQAFDTIQSLRDRLAAIPDANGLVGGPDAQNYDTERAGVRDQEVVIPLVLIVILVILSILLRSILAPVLLLLTSVLSTTAALGVTVIFFTSVLGYEGLQAGVLLIGFVFLIALGVDYNIFLMSRVHEESPVIGTRPGMLKALAVTGGVITSAGIVLAATFAVLGLLPIVALAQVGFLVSFGVLLDTLIVRSFLVPALTMDLGKVIWWPSSLSRHDGEEHSTIDGHQKA